MQIVRFTVSISGGEFSAPAGLKFLAPQVDTEGTCVLVDALQEIRLAPLGHTEYGDPERYDPNRVENLPRRYKVTVLAPGDSADVRKEDYIGAVHPNTDSTLHVFVERNHDW